jgi:hypothetical protein
MNNNKSILTVLILIGSLNLLLTTWLVFDSHRPTRLNGNANEISPLPAELSATKREAIFQQIKNLYNAQDFDGLYAVFSRDVQVQIPKAEFIESIKKMKSTFDNIEDGAYSYYEFVGNQGGGKIYNLYYTVRLPKSIMSPKGSLKVGVTVTEGNVGIYGIFLNSLTQ